MTRRLPTVSSLGLARHCSFPWSSGITWPKVPMSSAAAYGSALHSAAEHIAEHGASEWREVAAELAASHELSASEARDLALDVEAVAELLQLDGTCEQWTEVPLAYCPATGTARRLPSSGKRDYSASIAGEICGTADMITSYSDERGLVVRDWKTGRYRRGHDPAADPQMRAYALAVARLHGAASIGVEYALVSGGAVELRRGRLDALELDLVAAELRAVVASVAGPPAPVPGCHCYEQWCPIVADCPRGQSAVAAVQAPATAIESNDQAAATLDAIETCEAALVQLRAALNAWALASPVALSGGRIYGAAQHSRKSIAATPAALAALEALGLSGAVAHSVSFAALARAAKERQGAVTEREAVAALAAIGAVKESNYTLYQIRKATPTCPTE